MALQHHHVHNRGVQPSRESIWRLSSGTPVSPAPRLRSTTLPSRRCTRCLAISAGDLANATLVRVTFKVPRHVDYGQSVVMTGNSPQLGNWNPAAGLKMAWSAGDVWVAEAELAVGFAVEYKFVVVNAKGASVEWQTGNNMAATVPPALAIEVANLWQGSAKVSVTTPMPPPPAPAPTPPPAAEPLVTPAAAAATIQQPTAPVPQAAAVVAKAPATVAAAAAATATPATPTAATSSILGAASLASMNMDSGAPVPARPPGDSASPPSPPLRTYEPTVANGSSTDNTNGTTNGTTNGGSKPLTAGSTPKPSLSGGNGFLANNILQSRGMPGGNGVSSGNGNGNGTPPYVTASLPSLNSVSMDVVEDLSASIEPDPVLVTEVYPGHITTHSALTAQPTATATAAAMAQATPKPAGFGSGAKVVRRSRSKAKAKAAGDKILEAMTISEMKVQLKRLGLPLTGNRLQLLDRLKTVGFS